ncbi:MAG: hypothetical protein GX442_05615 [Candidatus Riflebacteria bacterium]|nr:hypothetical protein [Candidatus Riflebacteria bacterium]
MTVAPGGGRRGNLLFVALFAILVLGILTVAYHRSSRHGQAMAFRFEQSEVVRQIAEAAATEALTWLHTESASPATDVGRWFLDPSAPPLPVPVSLTERETATMVRADSRPRVSVTARHVDFRGQDSQGRKYHGREGVGTVEITVQAILEDRAGGRRGSCELVRHHDYKVTAIVSRRDNAQPRTGYAQGFLLDHALFLRQGLREFQATLAGNLNHDRVRLAIDQDRLPPARRGKVFVGGTGDPWQGSNFVFANVDEPNRPLLPRFPRQKIREIGYDELRLLFPQLREYENVPGAMGYLQQVKGYFEAQLEPVSKAQFDQELGQCEMRTRSNLLSVAQPHEKNLAPGFALLSPDPAVAARPAQAEGVLEGGIRQRFLHFVHFHLDLSQLPADIQEQFRPYTFPMPCTPMPDPPPDEEQVRAFYDGLAELAGRQPAGGVPLLSRFDTDFLYRGGLEMTDRLSPETFPRPTFFNAGSEPVREGADGPNGLQAFQHVNLWTRRLRSAEELEKVGILDRQKGVLALRGIVWVAGPLELGADGPLTVTGQGAIIAGDLRILNGLRKRSEADLAVLMTRTGDIRVETDQPVEASLVALGTLDRGGEVRPARPLTLRGALAAERLDPAAWADGTHVIAYDPLLKSGEDLHQITIGRGITFQRLAEVE